MAMKYYSDRTRQLYDTAEACEKAEFAAKEEENREKIRKERELAEAKERKEKAAAERKAMAAELEDKRKAMVSAQHDYKEALEAFCKKWGSYHYTTEGKDIPTLFDLFNEFFI